jgi:hypothetical protein
MSNVALKGTANVYQGQYGTVDQIGTLVHVQLSAGDDVNLNPPSSVGKQLIIVLDVSGSMSGSMDNIKSSLLAIRDAVLGMTPLQMKELNEQVRDVLFRQKLDIVIIPFSEEVREDEIWSSQGVNKKNLTFEQYVAGLQTRCMTNMGAGIIRAFELGNKNKFKWICVLTDGESNKGIHRTVDSFQQLVSTKPPNSKITAVGYGVQFNPEVLRKMGEFVYIETAEVIPYVFGNLIAEIMTTWAYNCVINSDVSDAGLDNEFNELNDDTIIKPAVSASKSPANQIIVGKRFVGTIYNGRTYDLAYILGDPTGVNRNTTITYQYELISNGRLVHKEIPVNHNQTSVPPLNLRKTFFEAEKGRIMIRLYHIMQMKRFKNTTVELNAIRAKMARWTDPICVEYKEEVNKMLEAIGTGHNQEHALTALRSGADSQTQTSFSSPYVADPNMSDTRRQYLESMVTSSKFYMSPK